MSSSNDFDMLRLEAPRAILMINDTAPPEHVEIASPPPWVRCLVRQQTQAERDLRQLYVACGDVVDRTDQRIVAIESAYNELLGGARYLFEQAQSNQRISEEWVRTELSATANAYQNFTQQVWEGITAKTTDDRLRAIHQDTQLLRLQDALAYQQEAGIARSQHLTKFQGDGPPGRRSNKNGPRPSRQV